MNLPEFPSVSSGFHPTQALGGCPLLRPCSAQGTHSALPTERRPSRFRAKIASEAMEIAAMPIPRVRGPAEQAESIGTKRIEKITGLLLSAREADP